ncbi:MAG: tetratricopeptide repeat protein [Planctomycetota bacterium]|nr:tetratricopeptide repeat protein [Planctomycetota bacterium]
MKREMRDRQSERGGQPPEGASANTGRGHPADRFLLLTLSLTLCLLGFSATTRAADEDLIEIRGNDEVYLKDNITVLRGVATETDIPGQHQIKDSRTGIARTFFDADVKIWKHRAGREEAIARLATENTGKPGMILRVAKEAMRRFGGPTEKLIPMLEKESGSKTPDLLAMLCELYLQTDQPTPALQTAETLVNVASGQARSYLLRGKALMALGKPDDAGKDLEKAFTMAPESQDVIVAYADFLLSRQPDKARQMFADAVAKNPKNVAALVGKGMVLLRQGEFPESEQSFNEALTIDGGQRDAKLGLAAVKIMTGKYDDAYRQAESVLNIDNRSAEAYELQAFAKLLAGDKDSLAVFNTKMKDSMEIKPNQPRLLLASAMALEREAKFNEVLGTPEGAMAAKQKRDEAAARYAEVFNSKAPDAYLQYVIGERKFRNGDYDGAEEAFQRAVKLAPRYAPAHAAVGSVALKLSKWDLARDEYSQAITLDGAVGEYHAGKGLALLKAKRFEEAGEAFKEARKLDRQNVTALCGLGYIANGATNKTSAVEFFQQALAVEGACEYAAEALRRIYAQDNMSLEYLTFADGEVPSGWRLRPGGSVKVSVQNKQVVFSGAQGAAAGGKVEFYKDVKADEFVRLEADLEMTPQSPVSFGLRLAASTLAVAAFEVEFGKDESNEIKVRYKDFGGQAPAWQSLNKTEWPQDGRVRLGLETDDLKGGKMKLWINGKQIAELKLVLQRPTRITVGAFVQAPPKEVVQACVDNVVLVVRGTGPADKEEGGGVLILKDGEKPDGGKKAPPPGDKKPEGDKDKDKPKDPDKNTEKKDAKG